MKFRVTMICISLIFMVNACIQCYSLGYNNAKYDYEDRIMKMKDKHTDEIVKEIKKRVDAECK